MSESVEGDVKEIFSILEELFAGSKQSESVFPEFKKWSKTIANPKSRYFCAENIFNSSHRVLTDTEIRVFKKVLEFAMI